MKHVYIASPVHSGQVCVEYVNSLMNTLPHLAQNGVAYTHAFIIGNALVHDARNRLVAWFLETECTEMLFIDADIGWQPEDALRLIRSPHDVIGGAYPQKRDDRELYNVAGLKPGPTRLLECDYLGTGFLKISRRAIEKLIEVHADKRYGDPHGKRCYGLFETPIEGGKLTGEDAEFCRRWRATGGKVFIDPDMTLHHVGQKPYRGNFGEMISKAEAAE